MPEQKPYVIMRTGIIRRRADNADIPMDQNNADYQEYLRWVAEGNEPDSEEEQ